MNQFAKQAVKDKAVLNFSLNFEEINSVIKNLIMTSWNDFYKKSLLKVYFME